MSIKVKLILMSIAVILMVSLPISLYNLHRQESERLTLLMNDGRDNARVITKIVMNVLLSNGGDIKTTSVDASDMLNDLSFMRSSHFVYAEVLLISKNSSRNGLVLFHRGDSLGIVPVADIRDFSSRERIREMPSIAGETLLEYVSFSSYKKDGPPVCAGRVIFSKEKALQSIVYARYAVYISTAIAIFFAGVLAFLLSLVIIRPIYRLISQVQDFESGVVRQIHGIKSHDEIGKLAVTFYHLTRMIELQIRELRRANEELVRIDRLKDDFMTNMSHELIIPVNGMKGIAESLISGAHGILFDDVKRNLSLIVSSGARLSHLVQDIEDFSRLRHRDVKLNFTSVDLYPVADQAIAVLSPMISRKDLRVRNLLIPGRHIVSGDENRIHQIIMNLLSNALKFTDSGEIIVSADNTGVKVRFCIADSGIGIAEEHLSGIFESYDRGDHATSREYGGTGIGLAITKNLVELHGGKIWVESEKGKGSRFFVEFDSGNENLVSAGQLNYKHDDVGEIVEVNTPEKRISTGAGKILVVDDDPVSLQLIVNFLNLENYQVFTAQNGVEALAEIGKTSFDLALIDILMPIMSGFETCRRIRKNYPPHELPVILLTTHGKPDELSAGFEAGANDYLVKPVTKVDLVCRVASLVSLRRSILDRDELVSIKRDIHIAHMIQEGILSEPTPEVKGLSFGVCYRPMYELGGDFYEIRKIDDTTMSVLIADVSGHGISAALLCSMLKISCDVSREFSREPDVFLTRINSILSRYSGGNFITACYGVLDMKEKIMTVANAGHWPPIIIKRRTVSESISTLTNGSPMGWVENEKYSSLKIALGENDRIVFYTDCFIDARNKSGVMIGEKEFVDMMMASSEMNKEDVLDDAMSKLKTWLSIESDDNLPDDATMIIVDVEDDIS
jgi:two-component system, sensor histidine kinase ChiS